VTIVEAMDRVLPLFDAALAEPVARWLAKAGVTVHLGAKAKSLAAKGGAHAVLVEDKDGKKHRLAADTILVTVGRRPNTQGWAWKPWPSTWRAPSSRSTISAEPPC